ncbi:MAG: hypothetical protein JXQ65_14320 [Candidatus Marinimicrobia bacterium]|nr:hypothetical protein [Candidatus Neomarinimicrobiota bacterium]
MIKKIIPVALFPILLFAQTVNIEAIIDPFPTPYISEWSMSSGIFSVRVTNYETGNITIDIKGEIIKDGIPLGYGYKRNIEISTLEEQTIDNVDFLELTTWNYTNRLGDQIMKTGRLPEGNYQICFSYEKEGVIESESCVEFEIIIPEVPDLIEPVDDINVLDLFPRFEWTPSFVPSALTINYRIIVCRNDEGEDPHYSITKVPILDRVVDNNFLVYPLSSPPLQAGYYVWQVQMLDQDQQPLGEKDGKTEIGRFLFGPIPTAGQVLTVNDGLEEDRDWSQEFTVSGNWSGESDEFYYSAGTFAGGADILDWTFAGPLTSFSLSQALSEGTQYFINVKAGEFGEVICSDGCTIDRTPPRSNINQLADSLQSPFEVKWTASDDAAGIQTIHIQRKTEDSAFVDWKTLEDTTTFLSFPGETGKTYSFRSRAIDKAGNNELWPDSADAKTYVKKQDDSTYILVPNVAYLKITKDTKIEKKDDKTTLKGKAKLVIEPDPFENFEKEIDLSQSKKDSSNNNSDSSGIVFEINPATNSLEPKTGKITLSDSSGIKKVYKDVFKIVAISFDAARAANTKMMVDSAFIVLPFKIPSQGNTNLTSVDSIPITASGLAFNKEFNKDWSKWGMTFTIKKLALAAEANPPYIEAKVNVKLNKSGETEKDKQDFATNATIGFRGENDIFAHIVPDSTPMPLIPGKKYVLLDSLWFEKPSEEWKLGCALQFQYPAPLDSITDQSKANILIGDDGFVLDLALINEERKSTYDKNDKTAFSISDYFAMDLTNVNLKLQSVDNNGKMELSKEHSYVEFMADVYLGKETPKRIAIGDPEENKKGFKVTFDGDTQQPGFKVKDNPFDIGPVTLSGFTDGAGLGITFEPFEISLSGGLGINKPGTFEGTVNFENLIINKNGLNFSNFAVLGGDITVMDIITASIDSIGYSAEPTTLTFKEARGDSATQNKTVEVDSYFRLAGASLGLNLEGDGGAGGCEEFLLYKIGDNTNVVIRDAWFDVKNTCHLAADLVYAEDPEPMLNFSGSAEIKESGIMGVALGKIGRRDGRPTFGIFMAASGIQANLGAVTLDEMGGGFFYRPLPADIDQVKNLCGLKNGSLMQNDISQMIQQDLPATPDLTFAIMLYAGMVVQSREICDGNGLVTMTDNYFELLAKAKMMKNEAEGNLQLLVSWDPGYAEGFIGFKMERRKVIKIDQNIEFFVYSDEVPGLDQTIWAVMGHGNVTVFPGTISGKLTTDFFLGPPGFYFDVDIEKDYDFWIIDGTYEFGTMFWWEKNVSWGAYADVHGSLDLDHVAGISCGLEGALIGTYDDLLIYSVGSFSASFMGETVYNGGIWVSLGTNGVHGGKGRNDSYDGYIESARDMAGDMKDEIENLTDDIESARTTAQQMTDEQRLAAGETLYKIVGDDNLADIADLKTQYQNDLNNFHTPNNNLRTTFNGYLFFNEISNLKTLKNHLHADSATIAGHLTDLQEKSTILINRIQNYSSRVTESLPQLAGTIALTNPVDTGNVITVNVGGRNVTLPINGNINITAAAENTGNATQMMTDITAYKDSMLSQADNIIDDLVFADSILYCGNASVNSLSIQYYLHSHKVSKNTSDYIQYYDKMMKIYGSKSIDLLLGLKTAIEQDLNAQNVNISETKIEQLIHLRLGIINYLLRKAGKPDMTTQDITSMTAEEKKNYCFMLGQEVWYDIPFNGMSAIRDNTHNEIVRFMSQYDNGRNQYFNEWNRIGNRLETIHNVKAATYQFLYNFFDDLSWEFEDGGPQGNNNLITISNEGVQAGGKTYPNFHGLPGNAGGYQNGFLGVGNIQGNLHGLGHNQEDLQGPGHNLPDYLDEIVLGLDIGTAAQKIRNFDTFSSRRDYISGVAVPPQVKKFEGHFTSDETTASYFGILTLDYAAEHAAGGCFYNLNISNYTPGPISLGVGQKPSFYFFRLPDPMGDYHIQLTAFANTGFKINQGVNLPVNYYFTPFEGQGGVYQTDVSMEDETAASPPQFLSARYENTDPKILFEYLAEDPESGISEYHYAVADSVWYQFNTPAAPPQRQYNIVKNWQSTGGQTQVQVKNLIIQQGKKYFILGKAKNGVGLWSQISISENVMIDQTPPENFSIVNFQFEKSAKQGATNQYVLTTDWTSAHDPESDVAYILGLGTKNGNDDLLGFAPIYNNQTYLRQVLYLTGRSAPAQAVLTIRAVNAAGLVTQKSAVITMKTSKQRGR